MTLSNRNDPNCPAGHTLPSDARHDRKAEGQGLEVRYLTQQIAEFVLDCRVSDMSAAVLEQATSSTLDTIASAIAGVPTLNATTMRIATKRLFGDGRWPVWLTGCSSQLGGAMLANCAAASALDIDDGHREASGHPGAAIVPAVLTAAAQEEWDGPQLLTAIVLGYDVALRINSARHPETKKSFASGRWCGYGVAAALGWLYGFTPKQFANALAIAGAEAPQSLPQGASTCMGTVKGSSPWSVLTALAAVERARADATGPIDLLDLAEDFDRDKILDGLGRKWLISETYIKPYAACRYAHSAIDAVLALREREEAYGTPIDDLTVEIFPEAQKITNDREPETLEAAQFSIPFTVALAAMRGAKALRPLREASLQDREVLELSQRVNLCFSKEFSGEFRRRMPARVRLRRGDIKTEITVTHPLGDVENPLDRTGIKSKFIDLSRDILPESLADSIMSNIDELRTGSGRSLLSALATPVIPFDDRLA